MIKYLCILLVLLMIIVGISAQNDTLVVDAPPDLQPVISTLYETMRSEALLQFSDEDPQLVVTTEPEEMALDVVYFLPDTALVLQEAHESAQSLMAFAISPDGQQVLIDAGLLPDVVTITDQAGFTVELPQPIRTTVSPYSIATYMVYTAGAGDRLIAAGYLGARDPLGAAAMERIDPRFPQLAASDMNQNNTNVEEIAELAPDVILSSARADWHEPVEELGIPIVRFEGETPDAIKEGVLMTGQLFGPDAAHRAQAWVEYYDRVLDEILSHTAELNQRPRVLFTGTQALRVASGEMYQAAIIEAAGGESVSEELSGFWNDVNLEQIIVWNPDVIFVPPYGGASVEAITENAEWQLLDAVQNGQVYLIPKLVAPWDTPVPDSVLGIIWMAGVLYPGSLTLDCADETYYFYDTFYDYAISDDEVATLCSLP